MIEVDNHNAYFLEQAYSRPLVALLLQKPKACKALPQAFYHQEVISCTTTTMLVLFLDYCSRA